MNKRRFNIWMIFSALVLLFGAVACEEDQEVQGDLPRLFRPIGLNADVSSTEVVISWSRVDSASGYKVEIYKDSLKYLPENLIVSESVETNNFTYELEGDTRFSVLVSALSSKAGMSSLANMSYTFETPAENIFEGFNSYMIGNGVAEIVWEGAKNVSDLRFVPEEGDAIVLPVSAEEMLAGKKICSEIPNNKYRVEVVNKEIVRGKLSLTIEGDNFLAAGADLAAAITAAAAGDVIVLAANEAYGFAGDVDVISSLKIRGLNSRDKSTIYLTAGNHMFSFGPTVTVNDNFTLENLEIVGFTGNDEAGARIRGVFDQTDACEMGTVKIVNSTVRNFARHIVRLRGGGQHFVKFEMDNCIAFDYSNFGDSYAIIYSNKADGIIDNIKISNSTLFNVKTQVVRYQNAAIESFLIENCNIDQVSLDPTRGVFDLGGAVIGAGGVIISNTIFGSTAPAAMGFKGDSYSIDNCYSTSDFDDSGDPTKEIKGLTEYGKLSTDLWVDPVNGDFTFKDESFVALGIVGDLNWLK